MDIERKIEKLRKLFNEHKIARIVGAHNPLGAKIIEKAGFEGIWASGLEISAANGVPDASILSMNQFINSAADLNDATGLPVVIDADSGYGDTNTAIYLIEQLIRHNIAGAVIEDKVYPKLNSFVVGKQQQLVSVEEFCQKIKAAKDTAKDKIMIFARVEALIANLDMGEALKRANAYAEAGADGIFIHSKKSSEEIREFLRKFKKNIPLILCPTAYPDFTVEEAKKDSRIKMIIYANAGVRSIIKAMTRTMQKLSQTNNLSTIEDEICPLSDVFSIQGMDKLKANEKRYAV